MKILQTAVYEIETAAELERIISENENVMVCCGRMGPMCIPVYEAMEELEEEHSDVKFCSMGFDSPESAPIRNSQMCNGFRGLPFTVYYKNGEMVEATSSIQHREQITPIINEFYN